MGGGGGPAGASPGAKRRRAAGQPAAPPAGPGGDAPTPLPASPSSPLARQYQHRTQQVLASGQTGPSPSHGTPPGQMQTPPSGAFRARVDDGADSR